MPAVADKFEKVVFGTNPDPGGGGLGGGLDADPADSP